MAGKIYSTENKVCGIGWYEVCPWSLEQYQKAASYPEFLISVRSKLSASNGHSADEIMMLIQKNTTMQEEMQDGCFQCHMKNCWQILIHNLLV